MQFFRVRAKLICTSSIISSQPSICSKYRVGFRSTVCGGLSPGGGVVLRIAKRTAGLSLLRLPAEQKYRTKETALFIQGTRYRYRREIINFFNGN